MVNEYKIWDRISPINGVQASHFLNDPFFKQSQSDIILIINNGSVQNIERKDILASIYGIDENLPLREFMLQVEVKQAVTESQSYGN